VVVKVVVGSEAVVEIEVVEADCLGFVLAFESEFEDGEDGLGKRGSKWPSSVCPLTLEAELEVSNCWDES